MHYEMASFIDHTLLSPIASHEQIMQLCYEGATWKCASVCVHPYFVPLAVKELKGSACKVTTVVGFPLGQNMKQIKLIEAKRALDDGAEELDVVMNLSALKEGLVDVVLEELSALRLASGVNVLKVIIETALLTDKEKHVACDLVLESGADFVKTSTGFAKVGATAEDVQLLRTCVGARIGVKASGEIHTFESAKKMLAAGASRLGCSQTRAILFPEG